MTNLYNTITDYPSADGAMALLYAIRDGVPYSFEVLLIAINIILFSASYYLVKFRTGRAKILIALLASSFFVVVLSSMLALAALITFKMVIFFAFITIIWFILLVLSDSS